jgi:predicted lipoprotein with Yx(FWY)xxD motif
VRSNHSDKRCSVQRVLAAVNVAACSLLIASGAMAKGPAKESGSTVAPSAVEAYVAVPMPPGFRVEASALDGPVFADANGRTLYTWPSKRLRNGYSGETKGNPACYDKVQTETAGLMSPYPPGIALPELDKRPSCTTLWPPVLAADDAKPVGKWTILTRKDGKKQWAFDEQPLYTSNLDSKPGDVLGGTSRRSGGDSPAIRAPAGPPSKLPPGFAVKTTTTGRLLGTDKNDSVYAFDKDSADKSACDAVCARTWKPMLAPQTAQAQGDWSTLERSTGVRQWVFRGKPLYTYTLDTDPWSLEGSDVEGWHNVYTQRAPPPPASFTKQETIVGEVLADARGMTIYTYICGDDSVDQLSCDHPSDTQAYRLAMCGGPQQCRVNWPYVLADKGAKSVNRLWTVMQIDPQTGHRATAGQAGALSVWAYRDRPVYTYAGDKQPGDVSGDGTGEWRGQRNGLKAFWLRDDYFRATM